MLIELVFRMGCVRHTKNMGFCLPSTLHEVAPAKNVAKIEFPRGALIAVTVNRQRTSVGAATEDGKELQVAKDQTSVVRLASTQQQVVDRQQFRIRRGKKIFFKFITSFRKPNHREHQSDLRWTIVSWWSTWLKSIILARVSAEIVGYKY